MDTIIFIKDGEIKKVYELKLTVKVPTGMTEADLARPVVEVRDFETGELEYEIYTFGEENVVVPVKEVEKGLSPVKRLAAEKIRQFFQKFDRNVEVEIVSDDRAMVKVDNKVIPKIIGKEGKNISQIEEKLGIHIDVVPKVPTLGKEVEFEVRESGNYISLVFDKKMVSRNVSVYIDGKFLFSATVSKKGDIKVNKSSDVGKELVKALVNRKKLTVTVGK
ncbi:MAG: hypothetical protein J7K98_02690 [Candidatus Aenigmarchaeota archaeon]|nr:hypothetical protein [Candidatus Aenigmarchaeota archaeon]